MKIQCRCKSGEFYFYKGRSEFATYPNYLTLGLSLHLINNKFLPFKRKFLTLRQFQQWKDILVNEERLRYYSCSENRQLNEQLKNNRQRTLTSVNAIYRPIRVVYITVWREFLLFYYYHLSCGCLAIPLSRYNDIQ